MSAFDEIGIGVKVYEAQRDAAVLPKSEDLSLVAKAQVHLGEREAVVGLLVRLVALVGRRVGPLVGRALRVHEAAKVVMCVL